MKKSEKDLEEMAKRQLLREAQLWSEALYLVDWNDAIENAELGLNFSVDGFNEFDKMYMQKNTGEVLSKIDEFVEQFGYLTYTVKWNDHNQYDEHLTLRVCWEEEDGDYNFDFVCIPVKTNYKLIVNLKKL